MATEATQAHWLSRYAKNYYRWRTDVDEEGRTTFKRPHGLVENFFSYDGTDREGRADISFGLTLDLKHQRLTYAQLRLKVLLAWASLRLQHVLLMSRVVEEGPEKQRSFVIGVPENVNQVVREAKQNLSFLEERGTAVDLNDFYHHCANTARVLDASKCLSRLFVLPWEQRGEGEATLKLVLTVGHEISDGMSTYHWMSHFIRLLNTKKYQLLENLKKHCMHTEIESRLPVAQEDLYPQIPGSKARQRWFWAIARILRHVRRPLPAGFENPLQNEQRTFPTLEPKYSDVLDYSEERRPPLKTGHCLIQLPPSAFQNLREITRNAGGTVGAACFALVALAMMELEEERHPNVSLAERKPMIISFPLNPKPYFGYNKPSESCMLSFGSSFTLPFLSSELDKVGRFRLLLKQCQRKLGMYQKRIRSPSEKLSLAAYSPSRLLASGYIAQLDGGWNMKRPNGLRRSPFNPQGDYPSSKDPSWSTNGVSSVGSLKHFFDDKAHSVPVQERSWDLEARWKNSRSGVRAREGEFLVGSMTLPYGLIFSVSYDASIMDEEWVGKWKEKMETLLLPESGARL
ncbi:hypothetical protein NA57DRAFT_79057 [Rhizodiscina lignyota]|uniref:Condensation domain-containing protein n=1 Tax=Rhizodiscina lignyota TaxID=1504668 RepID=A0A9P4I6Y5_9PEZI|nr:hypothetical protein NA57DRAFT_79057 [Rhizodiscina lignyota]